MIRNTINQLANALHRTPRKTKLYAIGQEPATFKWAVQCPECGRWFDSFTPEAKLCTECDPVGQLSIDYQTPAADYHITPQGHHVTVTRPDDPAQTLLNDDFQSQPVVYEENCYICNDPEFAQMGLPLCRRCPACGGHVQADDVVCWDCGLNDNKFWQLAADTKAPEVVHQLLSESFTDRDWHRITPTPKQLQAAIAAYERLTTK